MRVYNKATVADRQANLTGIIAEIVVRQYHTATAGGMPYNNNQGISIKDITELAGDKMHEILENLYKDKKILDHGVKIGKQLAFVLSGGNTSLDKELSEDDMLALERDAFLNLIQMPKTQERIKHTLETGKPLVN